MHRSMVWMATASLVATVLCGSNRVCAQHGAWGATARGPGPGSIEPGWFPHYGPSRAVPPNPDDQPDRRQPHHPYPHYDHNHPGSAYGGGWFQRPYPYHLDYYRMRYGGSYAPYFGNLYGPPVMFPLVVPPISPYFGRAYDGWGTPGAAVQPR